ncbi:6-phosphogluconolactonase [Patescibacteria group bacterium]|nr:6-phosphogluconolactonase [Patescibacteria group bacterium]
MEVRKVQSREAAVEDAAGLLNFELEQYQNRPVLLLLSGGSSLAILEKTSHEYFGPHVTVGALDERYSQKEKENNFAQIAATYFFREATQRGAAFIDTRVREGETQEALVLRFERELRVWRERNPNGIILATIGIGRDGHTAGIMPYPEDPEKFRRLFEQKERWVVGYNAGEKNLYPERATVTLPFLRAIARSLVFLVGEEKRGALERVLAEDGELAATPGRVVRDMADVTLVTDIRDRA